MAANRMIRNNPGSVIDIIRMDGIHKTTTGYNHVLDTRFWAEMPSFQNN